MNLITPTKIFQTLKTREQVILKCVQCEGEFNRLKKDALDFIRLGGLNGSFCSPKCHGLYKTNEKTRLIKCLNCGKETRRRLNQLKKTNNKSFCSCSCSATYYNSRRFPTDKSNITPDFIKLRGRQKKTRIKKSPTQLTCNNCNTTFFRLYPNPENKHRFCSRSCQAIYANKTWNRASRFGINKSRAESAFVKIIKTDFPNLEIIENDRKILDGLELDVFIPSKNVAIELNGPCHYIPIFGKSELEKTQNKDVIKKQKMQELGIHFFQINIMGAGKNLHSILLSAYNEQIKSLLSP